MPRAAKAPVTPIQRPQTLGSMIDALNDAREEKRQLNEQLKTIKAAYDILEAQIIERLDSEESRKAEGRKAGVSITEVIVGNIEDYDALCRFVKRTGNFQLFQRRISDPAFRELMELKGVVPGLVPFTKRNLNLRSLGSA